MSIKNIWYLFFKQTIRLGLFFYTKKIRISGKQNIPKNEAVIFVPNHPNGLIDPLYVAVNNPRINHFLVRAAVFKKSIVKYLLSTLNLMPIYRIRDGKENIRKNEAIFKTCCNILLKKRALMIFAEGSHNCSRTLRPLKNGYLKIAFTTLQQNPNLKIYIVPVGITYQNVTTFPSQLALQYGKPILVNSFYSINEKQFISSLNNVVSKKLKSLLVHIPKENYDNTLKELQEAKVDFTKVKKVNKMIARNEFPEAKEPKQNQSLLRRILILNNIIPYIIWKKIIPKIEDKEFVDTFRFALAILLFPINLILLALFLNFLFDYKVSLIFILLSLSLTLIYVKKSKNR